MHPHRTHVPPRPSRSITAVERPSCPHRIAPTYPAGPPPRKITSYEAIVGNRESGIGNRDDAASAEARSREGRNQREPCAHRNLARLGECTPPRRPSHFDSPDDYRFTRSLRVVLRTPSDSVTSRSAAPVRI